MRIDYRELKQQIRILDLLIRMGWQVTKGRGAQLRGPCPLPGCCEAATSESSRSVNSFSVHCERNIYGCFCCQSAGTVLDFWQTYKSITLHQAAIELSRMVKSSNQELA